MGRELLLISVSLFEVCGIAKKKKKKTSQAALPRDRFRRSKESNPTPSLVCFLGRKNVIWTDIFRPYR